MPNIKEDTLSKQEKATRKTLEDIEANKPKSVYYVDEFTLTKSGEISPVIVVEGEKGYHPTSLAWGKDFKAAKDKAKDLNYRFSGITQDEADEIVGHSMH